jgi:hypothetical protein
MKRETNQGGRKYLERPGKSFAICHVISKIGETAPATGQGRVSRVNSREETGNVFFGIFVTAMAPVRRKKQINSGFLLRSNIDCRR